MTVPTLTVPQAAAHVGVTVRTIRQWVQTGRLAPIPLTRTGLGYYLFTPAAVAEAEGAAKRGRTRRGQQLRHGA